MEKFKGRINSIETFGGADGPGIRFIVFMQGCDMRCKYCHNPETWSHSGGEIIDADTLFEKAWRYRTYWGKDMSKGGVTVSGGEPLLQIDFLTEFFRKLKGNGVHTAIDTSGQPFCENAEFLRKFDELLEYTDLVLLDLKMYNSEEHKKLTGQSNENILKMAEYLSEKGIPMWIRRVLVPKLTDSEKDLKDTADFIKKLKTVERTEVLPYHRLGMFKWKELNMSYPLEGIDPPTEEEIKRAEAIL